MANENLFFICTKLIEVVGRYLFQFVILLFQYIFSWFKNLLTFALENKPFLLTWSEGSVKIISTF